MDSGKKFTKINFIHMQHSMLIPFRIPVVVKIVLDKLINNDKV